MNPRYRRLRFSFACLLLVSFVSLASQGCDEVMKRRAMPAPLQDPVEITYEGKLVRWWGGDNFEFIAGEGTHFLLLRGVNAPGLGEPFHERSRRETINLTKKKLVTVHVFSRDEVMREIVDVVMPAKISQGEVKSKEFDLGTELIRRGWARYNGDEFDGAERLMEAEASAKKRKVGMWAEPGQTSKKKSNDKE